MNVIDTSVIMAIVLGERGQERAAELSTGGLISSVNLAEVVAKCIERSVRQEIALDYVRNSNIDVAGFDQALSIMAGQLWTKSRKGILSLGDRACIATAIRHKGVAVTADRVWSTLDLGCPVELIR